MCGVVAALGQPDISEPLRRLAHRGIRHDVKTCRSGIVGHVRLPIVGVGEQHDQPMRKHDWLIGFVGELLDFRETNPGMECDAELVRDIWTDQGPQGFTKRDGFWGIAAVSDENQSLFVLTDYLGQKPMYYRSDYPSAASEPDALVPFGPVTLDRTYLSACVKWGYCPDVTRTPYNEIKHVLPGELVCIRPDHVTTRILVDPLVPMPSTGGEIRDEIELAVKRRVESSDVPLAALVSGGLDSAIVYKLARRYTKADIVPYFVESKDPERANPDLWNALSLTIPFAFTNHDPSGPYKDLVKLRRSVYSDRGQDAALAAMQEPIDLGSLVPQMALSCAVQERVCLTGDGADEVFGGYGRYQRYDAQWTDLLQEIPAWHAPRLDRIMMRNRIEVRTPFLARRVVQQGLALDHESRKDKILLRALFRNILPPRIQEAKKKALRAHGVEQDREYNSLLLVRKFVENFARTR